MQPRKKIHVVRNTAPFSKYDKIISYERDYTDIFRMTKLAAKDEIFCRPVSQSLEKNGEIKEQTRWKLLLC
jgi:hypothetical protein